MSFDNTDKIVKVFYDNRDQLIKWASEKASWVNYDYVKIEECVDDSLLEVLKSKIRNTDDVLKWQQIKRYCELVIRSMLYKWGCKVNEGFKKKDKARKRKYLKEYYKKNREKVKKRVTEYNKNNKDKRRRWCNTYRKKHIEKIRERERLRSLTRNKEQKNERARIKRAALKNRKVCSKCHIAKDKSEFYKAKRYKNGIASRCKVCLQEYRDANKGRMKKWDSANYRKKRQEKIDKSISWQKKNKQEYNNRWKEWKKKTTSDISDYYVKDIIKRKLGLPYDEITDDLIESKRLIIKIKRKIKNNGKENNQEINKQPSGTKIQAC